MNKKERWIIYIIFMCIYVFLIIFNIMNKSQWLIDSIGAVVFLTFVFLICEWFKMEKLEFILFNCALLIHNFGSFGFYELTFNIFAYDDIVHLVFSIIAAYIIFNFIIRKLSIKKKQRIKYSIIKENKVIFMFLVIASVTMLGVIVELIEYVGFMYFGFGEGILFFGSGDSSMEGIAGQYLDTMRDIIVNIIGSFIGSLIYYYRNYKKKPWLRY